MAWWSLIGGSVVVLALVGVAAWLLAPTLRTFRGPAFEPAPKDDASVLRAQQAGVVDVGH